MRARERERELYLCPVWLNYFAVGFQCNHTISSEIMTTTWTCEWELETRLLHHERGTVFHAYQVSGNQILTGLAGRWYTLLQTWCMHSHTSRILQEHGSILQLWRSSVFIIIMTQIYWNFVSVCIFFASKDCGDTWMRSGQQAKVWEWWRPICWLHGAHVTQESARHHRGKIAGTNPLSHPCNDVCWSWDNSKHYAVCCQVYLQESRGLGCAPGTQRKRKADLLLLLFAHHQLASL